SDEAIAILQSLSRFTKGDYVWTTTAGAKHISGFSKAKVRIDREILKSRIELAKRTSNDVEKEKNIPQQTLHDLRRTATTHMAKANVPIHVLKAILNHSPGSAQGVTAIYNRFQYLEERRSALNAWAKTLTLLELL